MKNILLIEPGVKHGAYPPMGLMHLAAVMRDNYNIIIKDYSGIELNDSKVKKDIENIDPFLIGMSVLTGPPITRAIRISKVAKQLGKKVIWGGPHPTILPEQTLENKNIDAVINGEGEYSFQDLVRYFEGKNINLTGVGIKKDKKIIITPPNKKVVDFNKLQIPAWDLLEDINRYFPYKKHNEVPISTTRGCAFKCGFCHNSNDNVRRYLGCYRIAPPERTLKEYEFIQSLVKNEINILDVGEDLHLVSQKYTKDFCKAIKESKYDIKWYTAARYHTLNKELIDMIANAGCKRILLGVESGSRRIQKMNNKVVDLNNSIKLAKQLRKNNIFVINAYIIGHPTETTKELNETMNFIKKIPADENLIQLYRPMPGTPYFQICVEKDKVKVPDKLEEWAGFGVLGNDVNISEIPTKVLFSTFYKVNLWQQTKCLINQQKFFLREGMNERFMKNFVENRFTFKLKQYMESKNVAI